MLDYEFSFTSVKGCIPLNPDESMRLGKLATKYEPTGKVIIFAITDCLTQTIMKPLSGYVFKILKTIPMDGTFNKTGSLNRLVSNYKSGMMKDAKFYSYDLSSATDILPISIQEQILSFLLNDEFASEWGTLLTNRD